LSFVLLLGLTIIGWSQYHHAKESSIEQFKHRDFPNDVNDLFAGSGKCAGCHGSDPLQQASVDDDLVDINVVDDWASSMMANSAKDPFWRAKVSHEILVNPSHQLELEDKCTACHAPQGHFNAKHNGQIHYGISDMISDSIALDGVSCSACHQLDPLDLGNAFSGELVYDTNKIIWGQYQNPFAAPMLSFVGFDAQYGSHVSESKMCATCHTLITETTDLSGNYTGDEFVEQATYHEWLNSVYNTVGGKTCQDCHMPATNDGVLLSTDHTFLNERSPFSKHHLVGGNAFMLEILKDHIDTLQLNASIDNFNVSIDRTLSMLQDSSQNLACVELSRTVDSVFYEVEIENLAGHKLPSGYPSRRMFVQFVVMDSVGDTLFESGSWDQDFEVIGHSAPFEPHYNMINNPNQIQIYEMVFGDVGLNKTTILERGFQVFKDNRLPPKGFTSSHSVYDTTRIEGNALMDANFNFDGTEGSGADLIEYHVPMNGYGGDLNVICRTYYQTAPPAWMAEMFAHSSPEIDHFKTMFDQADREPILMKQVLLGDIFTGIKVEKPSISITVFPNPTSDQFEISGLNRSEIDRVQLYSLKGEMVRTFEASTQFEVNLPASTYLVVVFTKSGDKLVKQLVVN
jgi:hypothetical protein